MSLNVTFNHQEPVPDGPNNIYRVRLDKIESFVHKTNGPGLKWQFTVIAPQEHAGKTLTGLCSAKLTPKTKLFAWVSAFGIVVQPGDNFDLETLIGKTVRAKVKNSITTKTVEGKMVQITYSNIDALGRDKTAAAAVPEQETPAPTPAPAPAPAPQVSTPTPSPTTVSAPTETSNNTVSADNLGDDEDFDF